MTDHTSAHDSAPSDSATVHAHVSPIWLLLGVFVALIVLTVVTVLVSTQLSPYLGAAGVYVALLIAAIKGALVVLFFMHLKYEAPFNALVFCVAMLFVALMIIFTIVDTRQYAPSFTPPPAVGHAT